MDHGDEAFYTSLKAEIIGGAGDAIVRGLLLPRITKKGSDGLPGSGAANSSRRAAGEARSASQSGP